MRVLPGLYVQQFRTSLAVMLEYRASLLIWLISHLLEPLVYLVVWSAVSAAKGGSVGVRTTQKRGCYAWMDGDSPCDDLPAAVPERRRILVKEGLH